VSIQKWQILVQARALGRDFKTILYAGWCSTNRTEFYTDGVAAVA
jgi:hypothetical protein